MCTGPLAFAAPSTLTVGGDLRAIIAADFNHDEHADLAVASGFDDTIIVFRGKGDGSFFPSVGYYGGYFPMGLAAADANGDGRIDLAVANFGTTVSVLFNRGDGSLAAPFSYEAGENPHSVAAADLNGDGLADVATTNLTTNDVSVLLKLGDGEEFALAVNYAAGTTPGSVVPADLDRDGDLDLIVADDGAVGVLPNRGDGTFSAARSYPFSGFSEAITVVDVDNDGHLDVAAAAGSVAVLRNAGDGTLGMPHYYLAGPGPRAITAADFDGDGSSDLAVANLGVGDTDVTLLRNLGDGTFETLDYKAGTGSAISVTTADLDHDDDPDVIVANFISGNVSVISNLCIP